MYLSVNSLGGGSIKTLYISDLDGTLLRSDVTISEYTSRVIMDLTSKGILFSYATARSYITATKVTEGLHAKIPIITYNGAAIVENDTGRILKKNPYSEAQKQEIFEALIAGGGSFIVYAYISGIEKFSYVLERCSDATKDFLMTRLGDVRDNPVECVEDLIKGEVFYFTCIDSYEKLEPLYYQFKDKYHCIFHKDIYSGEQWLEIMPRHVSKANAIAQLKAYLDVDYVVAFGDGTNDVEMFEMADEAYAVENAVEELKAIATGVIGTNDEDGVARWLAERMADLPECQP